MKLSRFYTNKPHLFEPLEFKPGLNVVLAEIRLPENLDKDTHNLGKTILGRLLDFVFLAKRNAKFFLFKHKDLFEDFVFFLEVKLPDQSYVTVRRSVEQASKISFKKHSNQYQDFIDLPDSGWDHFDVPFDRAREILDSLLDWRALQPWSFRKGLGYQLRSQNDFSEVFHLGNFAGAHSDWKPFLAHILGFNSKIIISHYEKYEELKKKKLLERTVKKELSGLSQNVSDSTQDISKIEGILLLKKKDADKQQKLLDEFDFRVPDKDHTERLVNNIDERIAELNNIRYALNFREKKVAASLQEKKILFDPDDAKRLFREAGVLFDGQIKKDFEQLLDFNRVITAERDQYLQEEYEDIQSELNKVNEELNFLGQERSKALAFLSETDSFEKYKKISADIISLRADITALERQRQYLRRLKELRDDIRFLMEERTHLQVAIEADVEEKNADKDSLFSSIRLFFSEIVEDVIDRKALLSVAPNKDGHLEFKAEILDESGNTTSADLGFTYRKLLCVAFDLAVLRSRLNEKFPHFVYHDGVFESLDDRKKENLLAVIRQYSDLGIQPIITTIDSDLPLQSNAEVPIFTENEILLTLHDENEQGRLFKMRAW